jgi:hypothetical protein
MERFNASRSPSDIPSSTVPMARSQSQITIRLRLICGSTIVQAATPQPDTSLVKHSSPNA